MAGLGSLYIDLLARTGKFETDIGRAAKLADRRAKEIDRSFSRLGSRIAGALGGIAAGFSLSAIITETANAEKALAALDNAVRNNAGAAGFTTKELADLSSELQKVTTYGDDAIQGMQALLLTFRQIGGAEFERAQVAALDLATALGQDLQSAAMLVGRALADPVGGMAKLARSGIILSDEQKNLVKQLVETGKATEAQGYILGQLEERFGGAAKSARDTFGGALEGLKNAFGDLLEQQDGLPKLTRAINEMTESLSDPKTQQQVDKLGGLVIDLVGGLNKLGEWISRPNRRQAGWLIDFLQDATEKAKEFKSTLLDRSLAENVRLMFYAQTRASNFEPAVPRPPLINQPLPAVITAPSEEFIKLSDKLEEQIALYGKVGKAAEIAYQIQSGALDELSESEHKQLIALARRYDAVVKSTDAQKKAAEEQEKALDEVTKMTQAIEQQVAMFGTGETATLEYRIAHGDLAQAFALAGENGEALKQKLLDLTLELEIMTEAANGAAEAVSDFASQNSDSLNQGLESFEADFEARFIKGLDALTVYQEQAARNTQDIIADTLVSGFDEGADGVLKSFGQMVQKLIAQAIAADIAKRLFGASGGGTGDGWIGMAAGWLAGNRAIGGPVLAGMNYRINEREPEFFRPRVGGDIIPLSKMPNMGGGGMSLVQNFSVRPESGDRVTRRTEQQIAAAASRGIAVASRRNN